MRNWTRNKRGFRKQSLYVTEQYDLKVTWDSSVLLSVTIELHRSRDCRASSSVASGSKTFSDSRPCFCDTGAFM
jgi:hypothetical protein